MLSLVPSVDGRLAILARKVRKQGIVQAGDLLYRASTRSNTIVIVDFDLGMCLDVPDPILFARVLRKCYYTIFVSDIPDKYLVLVSSLSTGGFNPQILPGRQIP